MQPTVDPITAWLDAETGHTELSIQPLETEEERKQRLINAANRKALKPENLFEHLLGVEHK